MRELTFQETLTIAGGNEHTITLYDSTATAHIVLASTQALMYLVSSVNQQEFLFGSAIMGMAVGTVGGVFGGATIGTGIAGITGAILGGGAGMVVGGLAMKGFANFAIGTYNLIIH